MRNWLVIAALLVAAISLPHRAAAQMLPATDDPLRRGHALLIGNSHYRACRNWMTCRCNSTNWRRYQEPFRNGRGGEDLEIDLLRQKINGFLRSYGNDSNARLFIYYAGHGYTETICVQTKIVDTSRNRHADSRRQCARLQCGTPQAMSMMEIRSPLAEVLANTSSLYRQLLSGTIFTSRAEMTLRDAEPECRGEAHG